MHRKESGNIFGEESVNPSLMFSQRILLREENTTITRFTFDIEPTISEYKPDVMAKKSSNF